MRSLGRFSTWWRTKSKQMLGLKEGTQKVVPISELEHWIEQGWDYKRDLPQGKAVIGLRDS